MLPFGPPQATLKNVLCAFYFPLPSSAKSRNKPIVYCLANNALK
ncbi:hypothetical protein Q7O_000960 [Pectobacterium carotovorum subsp. carotovorum PCCS1]|nr:hypothetical protein [Pectobacterium carotovorum subsp. carotovorum PCCS1]